MKFWFLKFIFLMFQRFKPLDINFLDNEDIDLRNVEKKNKLIYQNNHYQRCSDWLKRDRNSSNMFPFYQFSSQKSSIFRIQRLNLILNNAHYRSKIEFIVYKIISIIKNLRLWSLEASDYYLWESYPILIC